MQFCLLVVQGVESGISGQEQMYETARKRHKWVQPPLAVEHGFLPSCFSRETALISISPSRPWRRTERCLPVALSTRSIDLLFQSGKKRERHMNKQRLKNTLKINELPVQYKNPPNCVNPNGCVAPWTSWTRKRPIKSEVSMRSNWASIQNKLFSNC